MGRVRQPPSPGGGGSTAKQAARGDTHAEQSPSPNFRAPRRHPTPDLRSDPPPPGAGKFILLGEFGRAHGLKGEVRLKSFTEDPKAIARYSPLESEDGRSFTLKGVRPAGGGSPDLVIARVEGVATREAAEALCRIRLYAPRERLHGSEGDDEFLLADLVGLVAEDKAGVRLGTVVAVPNYGGGDLLEIAPADGGPTGLLPFTEGFVPAIDVAGGRVVLDPPEGFFDTSPSPVAEEATAMDASASFQDGRTDSLLSTSPPHPQGGKEQGRAQSPSPPSNRRGM
jgi:16S rRNA processing protein RimM